MTKIAIILRGVPGSGKSTFIETLRMVSEAHGFTMSVHSTDNKFMVDGEYKWDTNLIKRYHKENREEFTDSLESGVNIVVCDNTNIRQRDYDRYYMAGKANDYQVIGVTFYPDTVEKHVTRNTHNVPEAIIISMRKRLLSHVITDRFDREVVIYPEKYSPKKLLNVAEGIIKRDGC